MNLDLFITPQQGKWISDKELFNDTPLFSHIKPISKEVFETIPGSKIVAGECYPALTLQEVISILPRQIVYGFLYDHCSSSLQGFTASKLIQYAIELVQSGEAKISEKEIQLI